MISVKHEGYNLVPGEPDSIISVRVGRGSDAKISIAWRTNERMDEWTNRQTNGQKDKQMEGQKDGLMDLATDQQTEWPNFQQADW